MNAQQSNPHAIRWNEKQAAQYLGISHRTLQAWRIQGRGPVYLKLGKAVRYEKACLDAWIEAQTRHSTSEESAA